MSSRLRSWSTRIAGSPNSAPRRSAASLRMSASALTSSTGKRWAALRYAVLILPHPMIPIPTVLIFSPFGRSPLDRARGETCDDVFLRHEKENDRRQDRQRDESEDQVPFGRIFALIDHDAERPGIKRIGIEHHQRQQLGVPAVDEGDGADGREDRP